ncbi:MAG: SpoIIE family protein phosphatase, partial [Frisingicoccus sp.]|nr:SpoIIE family protein phosphatase [Frisingicoccus sp.]
TGLSWRLQTSLSLNNTIEQLNLNIQDVKDDINAASDKNLLRTTESIARALSNLDSPSFDDIARLCKQYNVAEINIVNSEGIIVLSSNLSFKGYNMASGSQSAEFLVLLDGKTNEYVQEYGPISSDETMFRKYAGVVLEDGGFVQVAYDGKRLQEDISGQLVGITKNRRIGEDGCIIIADKNYIILSDRHSNDNVTHTLEDIGINVETLLDENSQQLDYSLSRIHDEPSIYTYDAAEGYYIIGVMPQAEALFSREVSSYITFFMQTVIYGILFILISFLIKHLIGDNLEKINQSLKQITEGDLDVIVNVRNNAEFVVLSDSINATVVTLKHYIDEASEKMEQELKLAKDIQYSSLPNVFPAYPNRKEFDIYALMDTAKEVGGDFYDFYMLGDKHLAFLIADVSGKGIPAALFMMRAKTVIKSLAEAGNPVNDVFTLSNKKLCENNDAEMFVTGWMGILNLETGIIEYANAGHNPPLVRKKNGNFEYLKTRPGFVLGGMEGVRYKKNEFQLEPGDEIFLYTDGVTEATDKYDALYSEERLQNFMNSIRNADCETLCRMIRSDIDRFVGTAPQFDDITMLSLKYKGGPEYEKNHN